LHGSECKSGKGYSKKDSEFYFIYKELIGSCSRSH